MRNVLRSFWVSTRAETCLSPLQDSTLRTTQEPLESTSYFLPPLSETENLKKKKKEIEKNTKRRAKVASLVSFLVIQSAGERGNEVLKRRFFSFPLNLIFWISFSFFAFCFFASLASSYLVSFWTILLAGLFVLFREREIWKKERERQGQRRRGRHWKTVKGQRIEVFFLYI